MHHQVNIFQRSLQINQWKQLRSIAQLNVKIVDTINDANLAEEWAKAKPFSEVPGPNKFQLIRGFLPGGAFHKKSMNDWALINRQLYGDLVRVPGVFGKKDILLSFNPDDFRAAIRSEGIWPKRRLLETLTYHRKVHRKDEFDDGVGLLATNDEDWAKIRTAVNPVLMQPRNARLYLNKMLEVNNEFLQRIREIRDPETLEMPATFEDELNRLTFESIAVVALNQQIGLIRKDRDNVVAKRLFKVLRNFFNLVLMLDMNPSIWKIVKTPKFNEMMKNYDEMYEIIMKYINEALARIENNTSVSSESDEEKSVLEKLLKIDKKIAIVMALDLLMAGVDTTSTTLVGILLCLAKNKEKQEKLRQELRTILPQKDSLLTLESMKNLPYLRACIKEGMRTYPISLGIMRTNEEEILMNGYQIEKNQDIMLCNNLLLMEDRYIPNAKEFIPERWVRDEKADHGTIDPFLFVPFGHGSRSCVGRRLVELELEITITRLVRNFNIEFNYSVENAFKNHLINVPAIPLKFKMSELEN
ncbi:cytochrome P450 CYP12A2-like [Episyrphus balteatus]|uniref:cytochrome P450 CYP12A2-like n=1 Tax=Episyrphus balteatus TaxID=286459 RepID=UPI002484DC26|nr:cytochrome P450 CYP12A2-like [Episyrphus balteatus]